jgi:hypothetical protein
MSFTTNTIRNTTSAARISIRRSRRRQRYQRAA